MAQIGGFSLGLFACAMVCHGELVRLKPGPRRLTAFYLMVAAGGALGGVFVTLVAPFIFKTYVELNVGHLAFGGRGAGGARVQPVASRAGHVAGAPGPSRCRPGLRWTGISLAAAGLVGLAVLLVHFALREQRGHRLHHAQFLRRSPRGGERRGRPREALLLAPARPDHPRRAIHRQPPPHAGELLRQGHRPRAGARLLPAPVGIRVWVVGMGTATMAAYGQPGDLYRFFEINSNVVDLAKDKGYFTYFTDSPAQCEVVMGDARLSIEREPPDERFDVLVLDAFSSDAIPVHLLTREAFEIYLRHMNPGGIIAVHISNRHLDLEPVVVGLAERFGLQMVSRETSPDAYDAQFSTQWILLTNNEEFLATPEVQDGAEEITARPCYWTDDFSNLFTIIRWRQPLASPPR